MARLTMSKTKGSPKNVGVSSRDMATLAAELDLEGFQTANDIIRRLISFMKHIKGKLASSADKDAESPVVDVIENVIAAIRDTKCDLEPYSGLSLTRNTSLSDIVRGTITKFEGLQTKLGEAETNYATAKLNNDALRNEFKTLRRAYKRINDRNGILETSYAHSEEERGTLAERVETLSQGLNWLGEVLGLPEHERSSEAISNYLVTLVADATADKEQGVKDQKFAEQSIISTAQLQEDARSVAAHARTNLATLREKYDIVKHNLDSIERERSAVTTIIEKFSAIWECILRAWDNCYTRDTDDFRNGVLHVWQHLCNEIWSNEQLLPSPAQVGTPAGDSRYDPWTVTNNFSNIGSGEKHDLDLELSCIFLDASRLWRDLQDTRCSAHISPVLPNLDQSPVPFPLVIVRSASGSCASLGHENLLSIA